ncbi:MAG: RnfABCDGE type electron transport complex subunit B [Gammaproteobacteria bacterium]|nr:RnfABCDGE type electron transport complex subunit B [Gammaproteobacteria bacterium]
MIASPLIGILVLAGLALALSAALVLAARWLGGGEDDAVERVERLLPRIQCAQCGYAGCRPYAEAIVSGDADINRCPPGGERTIRELAGLLGREPVALDASLGEASMDRVARIDEAICIGCNLCVKACPVDAIAGIPHAMHTVIERHCTGCELCLPPCPVDCISLVARGARVDAPSAATEKRGQGPFPHEKGPDPFFGSPPQKV